MKTPLLIMAAGIGSRFGTGIKQLEPVDDAGEHLVYIPILGMPRMTASLGGLD